MPVDPATFTAQLNSSWDADDVPNAVAAFFAEDAVMWFTGETSPDAPRARGRDQVAAAVRAFRGPFPDFRETFRFVAQDANRVVVEWVATGTHTGTAYEGISPSGRSIKFSGVNIFELDDDGLIKIERPFWDPGLLIRQLTGGEPQPVPAAFLPGDAAS